MKRNYFIRIFITYILIILTGSILTGLFSIQLFKQYFVNAAIDRMQSNIRVIETSIYEQLQSDKNIDYNKLAEKYSEDTGISVTFIDINGKVIGKKNENDKVNYNLSKEFGDAKANKDLGSNYYFSNEYKTYILDIAKYVDIIGFNGYIHLSLPISEISEANKGLLIYSMIGVIFVLFSSFILKILFEKDIISPLQQFVSISRNFDNNPKERVNLNSDDIIGIAAKEFNNMLDRIESLTQGLENKNSQIEFGLNNVDLGLLVVDTDSRIIFVNPFMSKLFKPDTDIHDYTDKKVIELIKDLKISNAIKECIQNDVFQQFEYKLDEETDKDLLISIKDFKDNNNEGCLVIVHDITQIKKLEKISGDFISNVTHELKTPLTSIRGFIETLKDGAIEDKNVAYKFLEIIDVECDRLFSLINDILQLSQIQDLEQDINREFNYIQDILMEVITFLNNQAKKKEISLTAEIHDKIPLILVNKNRIKQMLINIVDNAIKYTNIGGMVKIKAIKEDDNVIITVEDDGIGIPKESIPRLFERFYRVDKGRSRSQGGTGLGLCIVKQIAELYGGKVEVESEVGIGTEFKITLPLKYN